MLISEYSDLTIQTPACHPESAMLIARFNLNADTSHLMPLINAEAEKAMYFENPLYIKFMLDGIGCALYPKNAAAGPFGDRDQAVAFISRFINYLNEIHEKRDTITPDMSTCKQIPVIEIFKLLPGTNCGKCDFPTCMAFAAALSKGEIEISCCSDLLEQEHKDSLSRLTALFT